MVEKFKLKRGQNIQPKELYISTKKKSNEVKNKPRISLSNSDFGKY